MTVEMVWSVPEVEHPDIDMLERQRRVVRDGRTPLPYEGLPREWVRKAIDVALMFDPDNV